jgi:hypothetical protein
MGKRRNLWIGAGVQLMVLSGCAPTTMAPTVTAIPGPEKSAADFAADQTGCASQANQQVAPAIQAANNQIITSFGGSTSQTAQTTLQQQYNQAFSDCMYAKGDAVPGWTPVAAEPTPVRHAKRYAKKKPAATPTTASFVEPAPAAGASSGQPAPAAPAAGGGGFVLPAAAASAAPAASNGGFAVPPPASH